MKSVCIFAGTTEGRTLAESLACHGIFSQVCVATEYGENVMQPSDFVQVKQGRMDAEEMETFIRNGNWYAVVDATHPFATKVSLQIKEIMSKCDIPFFRLQRSTKEMLHHSETEDEMNIKIYADAKECANALMHTTGQILLTTGSKDLHEYAKDESLRERLVVRVLPGIESLSLCQEAQLSGKQIIAMQGPFTEEMNIAMLNQYHISHMVTKESGRTGGLEEKLLAAMKTNTCIHLIGNPEKEKGYSYAEVLQELSTLIGQPLTTKKKWDMILAGIGMGNEKQMLCVTKEAIEKADVIFGAKRMVEPYETTKLVYPYYLAKDIIPVLEKLDAKDQTKKNAVVLFSGDTGFYSGCQKLYEELITRDDMDVTIHPGISTISAMSAKTGISWQDATLYSIHGKTNWQAGLFYEVCHTKKVFLLLSGRTQLNEVGALFTEESHLQFYVANQLSYEEETIDCLSPVECKNYVKEGLLSCVILNPKVESVHVSPGKKDAEFIRAKVPMTKEEIREVSICKLGLVKDSVVYDVGSGTGSIAVEMALLSPDIQVYAIEQKEEAVQLIQENCQKFKVHNVRVIKALAPDGIDESSIPTHAFIGGSKGNLFAIIDRLYSLNHHIRIVINAISMETLTELNEITKRYDVADFELVQLQVSHVNQLGNYHLMQADNPVMICSFTMR